MELFYSTKIEGKTIYLEEQEAQHVSKSKRHQSGDFIRITDGLGHLYHCRIETIDKRSVEASILEQKSSERPNYELTIAISPLKNISRFEWFVEKAVELQVRRIVPILCQRTEKPSLRIDRLERIAISACKQCLQPWKPTIAEPIQLEDWLQEEVTGEKLIGYLGEEPLPRMEEAYQGSTEVTVLVGPEGDFTTGEIQKATQQGYQGISLGEARLRTETAGVACCQIIKSINYLKDV